MEDKAVAGLASTLEMLLVQGLGKFGDIEDAVMTSYLSLSYVYGDDADRSESSSRVRHQSGWMILKQNGRVLTWLYFEITRVSRKQGSLLSLKSAHDIFKSGVKLAVSRLPFAPVFLRTVAIPLGLALPPLLSLRFYSTFYRASFG